MASSLRSEIDLGTLSTQQDTDDRVVLLAPSRLTRVTWLIGAVGSFFFIWSMAQVLGWARWDDAGLQLVRWPQLNEIFFWLLPLVLSGFCLVLALGGIRVTIDAEGLELLERWPNGLRQRFAWKNLIYARFIEERTRNREQLFVVRFNFNAAELTLRLANRPVWERLRKRFGPPLDR